jgi:hypothetical protein
MKKRQLLKSKRGGFVKYKVAFSLADESFIVFHKNTILEHGLKEDEANRLAQFLNAHEYLSKTQGEQIVKEEFDFEAVYKIYPRKIGKATGIKRLKQMIKSREKYNLLLLAVENYAQQMKAEDEKYIKHFSSWVSVWEDYIPESVLNVVDQRPISFDDITGMMGN